MHVEKECSSVISPRQKEGANNAGLGLSLRVPLKLDRVHAYFLVKTAGAAQSMLGVKRSFTVHRVLHTLCDHVVRSGSQRRSEWKAPCYTPSMRRLRTS